MMSSYLRNFCSCLLTFLGNEVASGTEIIQRLGAAHMQTGKPILYTSADSVLQIAAHEDILPVPQLYQLCAAILLSIGAFRHTPRIAGILKYCFFSLDKLRHQKM